MRLYPVRRALTRVEVSRLPEYRRSELSIPRRAERRTVERMPAGRVRLGRGTREAGDVAHR